MEQLYRINTLKYMFWVNKYRTEGFHIYYRDDTCVNKNME